MRNSNKIFVGKPEGMRPVGRRRHRWKDNIRMFLDKQGDKVCSRLVWLRIGTSGWTLMKTVMNFRVP
jgi:hypothetical protein